MNDKIFDKSREVSLSLRLKILFGSSATQKLFGFFCFFMISLFLAKVESFVEVTFVGSTTSGYITNIAQTDNKIKEEVVYAFDYTFLVNDKIYNGTSYSTEKPLNDKITIEYRTKKPTDSYINGMLRKKVRWLDILLASFFPVFMIFVFVFYELKDNLKAIPLFCYRTLF